MKKDNSSGTGLSRRSFLKRSLGLAAGLAAGAPAAWGAPALMTGSGEPDSVINGVTVGVITYSYRSMQDQSARAILQAVVDSGIGAVELMGDPAEVYAGRPENPVNRRDFFQLRRKARNGNLTPREERQMEEMQAKTEEFRQSVAEWRAGVSMDKFVEFRKMFNDAGVQIYAFKPNCFEEYHTDEEVHYAFRAAKALGAGACTTEHVGNEHGQRLGDIAAQHQVYLSYHAHTQATPTFWDTVLDQSEYHAINLDIGHWVAAGNPSVLDFIRERHDRIESMHIKDRTTPENGAQNLLWGEGDTPISEVLQLIRDEKYNIPATIELEYEIPDDSDAVREVARCLNYSRSALTA